MNATRGKALRTIVLMTLTMGAGEVLAHGDHPSGDAHDSIPDNKYRPYRVDYDAKPTSATVAGRILTLTFNKDIYVDPDQMDPKYFMKVRTDRSRHGPTTPENANVTGVTIDGRVMTITLRESFQHCPRKNVIVVHYQPNWVYEHRPLLTVDPATLNRFHVDPHDTLDPNKLVS